MGTTLEWKLWAICLSELGKGHGSHLLETTIEDQDRLLMTLRKLMKQVVGISDTNPFDRLNQQICTLLDRTIQMTP